MTKNNETLEKRIDEIEKELAELKSVVGNRNREPWWRQIVGQFVFLSYFRPLNLLRPLCSLSRQTSSLVRLCRECWSPCFQFWRHCLQDTGRE